MRVGLSGFLALIALSAASIAVPTVARAAQAADGNTVLDVWPGRMPGPVPSNLPEVSVDVTGPHGSADIVVVNVTHPTLEVVRPTAPPNGAAIIIAPGGGFHVLSYANEGTRIAQWAASRGFTAFILKYRLNPMPTDPKEIAHLTSTMTPPPGAVPPNFGPPSIPMGPIELAAVEDGRQALKVVRGVAATYGFDAAKVGFIGFSAGGVVAGSQGVTAAPEDRASFVGIIYSYVKDPVPTGAPPAFMAAAADDPLSNGLPELFGRWRQAGASAELHIYAKGQHGFGAIKQGLPVDGWLDAFYAWMVQQGFVTAAAP